MRASRRRLVLAAVAVAAVGSVWVSGACLRDLWRAHGRVEGRSAVVPTPFGEVEYTQGGAGAPVLVVHGSGGGFDQGELLAEVLLGEGFHWINPSRFGYLRSTLEHGATFEDQAHAFAHLLDHLELPRVAVVAMSHGGPSALLFAASHPDRVSSLTLVSAGVASSDDPEQAAANQRGDTLTTIFRSDPLYWAVTKLFRKRLLGLIGASDQVAAGLTPQQWELVHRFIDEMNPVSLRTQGVAFDNRAAMPNERIAAVHAPTLVLHAADDGLQLYRNAEYAASMIPRVELRRFERGGHILAIVEQQVIREAIHDHLRAHVEE